jgi:hypothetical protein
VHSLNTILKHFKMSPQKRVISLLLQIKNAVKSIFTAICCFWRKSPSEILLINRERPRARSTFGRNQTEEGDYESGRQEVDYDDVLISVNKASEPMDILWLNLSTIEAHGHTPWIRWVLLSVVFITILFLSSPAVMFAKLKNMDPTSFLTFDWTS